MKRHTRAVVLALSTGLGCRCDGLPDPESPDAGARAEGVPIPGTDLRYRVPPDWTAVPPEAADRVVDARLYPPEGQRFMVAPRLVLSSETPDPELEDEAVFSQVLSEVRRIAESDRVQLLRSAKSVGRHSLGASAQLEVAYRVRRPDSPQPGPEVVHRSWVLLRKTPGDGRVQVTLTVTFLAKDREWVDVDTVFSGLFAAWSEDAEDAGMRHGTADAGGAAGSVAPQP
ncbi:MAG TPA: hypothetical protein RMG48_01905 [Myxococcales bacterium LLY-WYZ-16_1]|nr:hypothetical protein [Myxococcales bacterium LLY-WYZ-16_1]